MEILNKFIDYDKELLLFLHSKGNIFWDEFWLFITDPVHWIPLLILLFILGYKAFGLNKSLIIGLGILTGGIATLLIVNLIKNYCERLRPINDPSINSGIRKLIEQGDFSFVSGHAAISFTVAFVSYRILKKHYSSMYLIFLFPILFSYSRIYLAAHFPVDILSGMLLGYVMAFIFYKATMLIISKLNCSN